MATRKPFYPRLLVFLRPVRGACLEAWSDVRIAKTRLALVVLSVAWLLAILIALAFLLLFGLMPSLSTDSVHPACHPDGNFSPFGQTYNPWDVSGFFEVNLPLGNLTFTAVKTIDISWEIVVGRGGQAAMAVTSWRVFSNYVATCIATRPITYPAFRVLYLETNPSISSAYVLARDFLSRPGLSSKFAAIFIVWSTLFILAWPTIAGAATGYAPTTKPFVRTFDGNLVSFSYFQPLAYIIHDGDRVGLSTDHPVPLFGDLPSGDPIIYNTEIYGFQHDHLCGTSSLYSPPYSDWEWEHCRLQQTVSKYLTTNDFSDVFSRKSLWMPPNGTAIEIEPPYLNIEAFSIAPENWQRGEPRLSGWELDDPRYGYPKPFSNHARTSWTFSNKTYPLSYVEENGQCQPVQNRFAWGFSFIQTFIIVISLLVWTLGTYLLLLKSRLRLPFQTQLEVPRDYKAFVLFADTIVEQLSEAGSPARSLTNDQMKTEIRKSLRRGTISLNTSTQPTTFWGWVVGEWPWFIALALDLTATVLLVSFQAALVARNFYLAAPISLLEIVKAFTFHIYEPGGAILVLVYGSLLSSILGLLIAMNIGTSTSSRAFLLSCCTGLGFLVTVLVRQFLVSTYLF